MVEGQPESLALVLGSTSGNRRPDSTDRFSEGPGMPLARTRQTTYFLRESAAPP